MGAQPLYQTDETHNSPSVPKNPMAVVYTEAEYLAFDEAAEGRWEFMDGRILPVGAPERANQLDPQFRAGASNNHNELCRVLGGLFFTRLRKGCRAFTADARTFTAVSKTYTYPDLVVFCGQPNYLDASAKVPSLINPVLLVEVGSASTKNYDRSGKLMRYLSIESLQHYLMVDSQQMQVELYTRLPAGNWEFWIGHLPEQVIDLKSLDCQITLAELYDEVVFELSNEVPTASPE